MPTLTNVFFCATFVNKFVLNIVIIYNEIISKQFKMMQAMNVYVLEYHTNTEGNFLVDILIRLSTFYAKYSFL